jgi:hypothetical protein
MTKKKMDYHFAIKRLVLPAFFLLMLALKAETYEMG